MDELNAWKRARLTAIKSYNPDKEGTEKAETAVQHEFDENADRIRQEQKAVAQNTSSAGGASVLLASADSKRRPQQQQGAAKSNKLFEPDWSKWVPQHGSGDSFGDYSSPDKASDCHSMDELNAWRRARLTAIKSYNPDKEGTEKAETAVQHEFDENVDMIQQEQKAAAQNTSSAGGASMLLAVKTRK